MNVYDVFISYRRSDGSEIANQVYQYLSSKGLRVFLDREKMVDGKYFDTQIVECLKQSPNYILIASPDVFKFRKGEDWVLEEIRLALELYAKDPENHTINVIVPGNFDIPAILPEELVNLQRPNRIYLSELLANEDEKKRVLSSVTHINRHNMWNAGHKWLENAKKKGSRFSSLSIVDALLPEVYDGAPEKSQSSAANQFVEKIDTIPVIDKIGCTDGHLLLVGEGGVGKTTSLIRIMAEAYSGRKYLRNSQIPLFIEMASAPDTYGTYYRNGKSTFLRRMIYHQVSSQKHIKYISQQSIDQLDDAFSIDPETAVFPINDLFTKDTDAPEYILLMDGLNEVSHVMIEEVGLPVVQLVYNELQWLMTQCPNVRVILTSRTEEFPLPAPLTVLKLSGISDQIIQEYLQVKGKSQQQLETVAASESLRETLRIPLFLLLYSELDRTEGISTRGEILNMFYNQKSESAQTYTQQNRLEDIEESVKLFSDAVVSLRLDAMVQNIMLDFLLPELACHMMQSNRFFLDFEDIGVLVYKVLTNVELTSPFGIYGRKYYYKYRSHTSIRQNTYHFAKKLLTLGNSDPDEIAELFLNCCVYHLGILHERNGQFGFIHHHIRDYFAARKYINCLELAVFVGETDIELAVNCLDLMNNTVVQDGVLWYIGEILGEHRNKPIYKSGWEYQVPLIAHRRNLIERNIDICRGKYDGYALLVRNLIKTIQLVREDMAGINLCNLDLTACDLSYSNMGHLSLVANLEGSKLAGPTVLSYGHENTPNDVCYAPDGMCMVTANRDGTVKFWNKFTLKCERTIVTDADVSNITFSPDGKMLVVILENETIALWNWRDGTRINTFQSGQKSILSVSYSHDGMYFATVSLDGRVKIWETVKNAVPYSEKVNWQTTIHHSVHYNEEVCLSHGKINSVFCRSAAVFHPLRYQIAVASSKTIVIWDILSVKYTDIVPVHEGEIGAIAYHPSGKRIAFGVGKMIEIWDVDTLRYIGALEGHNRSIRFIQYNKDGRYLLTTGDDHMVCLWDLQRWNCKFRWTHPRYATKAIFSPEEDKILVQWEIQPSLEIFNATSGTYEMGNYGFRSGPRDVRYIASGKKFISGSRDGTIRMWDAQKQRCICTMCHNYSQKTIACDNEGKYVFGYNERVIGNGKPDFFVCKWDTETLRIVQEINIGAKSPNTMSYHSDKQLLAVATVHGYQIWDMKFGQKRVEYTNPEMFWFDNFIGFSPNGEFFITSCNKEDSAGIVSVDSNKLIHVLTGHTRQVTSAVFSNDSRYIATSSNDKTARIWDAETYECLHVLEGHKQEVNSIRFSKDGLLVVTASSDRTARIWSTENGKCVGVLEKTENRSRNGRYLEILRLDGKLKIFHHPGHSEVVWTADFSPDGKYIITTSNDGCVKTWDIKHFRAIESIRMLSGNTAININGVRMTNLHSESSLSKEDKKLLSEYGARLE